jgi:hypothetical protein
MPGYPLLDRPLPPGLGTLADYGDLIGGYSGEYVRIHWGKREGFPVPVGEVRRQRGRRELVYEVKALDAFRATQAGLWGRRVMPRAVTRRDLDERITLGEFAGQLAGVSGEVMAGYLELDSAGFPAAGPDGKYRLGDLLGYWNTRPIILPGCDLDSRVALREVAAEIGVHRKTVEQYKDRAGFPEAGPDGKYRLGDVLGFLNTRLPGKRGASAKAAA